MGTMAATVLGGASTVGTVRLGYVHGISGFWLCAALGAGIVVLNLFLAKPLLKLRIYTVTQVLERRYSPATRRVSALVMMAYALMLAATSVIATGTVMHVLFDLPFWAAVLLGGGVVVIYSAVGGMWSLTLTDIVQFVIKTVGLMFVLLPICIMRVGGWDQLVARLPAASFDFTTIGWSTIATYFVIYFFGILIGQDIWQRVFTARTTGVARVAGSVAGVYCVLYGLAGALIGMAAKVLLPDLDNPNNAFAAIVQASLPDGIRGLVIAAALAAMMSTASAAMLATSTVLAEDLLPALRRPPLREREFAPPHHAARGFHGRRHRAGGGRCAQRADLRLQPAGGRHAGAPAGRDLLAPRHHAGRHRQHVARCGAAIVFMIRTAWTPTRPSTSAWPSASPAWS